MTTFLDRLRDNSLTDTDQYRTMKKSLREEERAVERVDTEEWKNWELTPVGKGRYSDSSVATSAHSPDGTVLQKALSKL